MDNKRIQSCQCRDPNRELIKVLMEISDVAEQAAMHLMILSVQRKTKGAKIYDKQRIH